MRMLAYTTVYAVIAKSIFAAHVIAVICIALAVVQQLLARSLCERLAFVIKILAEVGTIMLLAKSVIASENALKQKK